MNNNREKEDIINLNEDDNETSGDNKSRMNERLKRIIRQKNSKFNNSDENTDNDQNDLGSLKRFFLIPVMFLSGALGKRSEISKNVKKDDINNSKSLSNEILDNDIGLKNSKLITINNKKWNNSFKERFLVNSSKFSKKRELIQENLTVNKKNIFTFNNGKVNDKIDDNKEVQELEKEIIKLIKKRLVKLINEYEMIGSDFYVLKELLTDDIYYDKCLSNVKEIKRLLSKINALKDKYDYLKENIDFDDILELDDRELQEKIIKLRNKLETDNLNYLVKDYKLLKEYQGLYLKIDKLQIQAYEYEDERKKRIDILKDKKIDFEKFKLSVYNYKSMNNNYSDFVKKQNIVINELSSKIGAIDSYEKVEYIYKGYRKILANSFKYIGLLLLSPLKGIMPGIATQTIVTKNVLDNLKKSFELEEKRRIIYEAIDYEAEINRVVNDIDYMRMVVDSSLDDVTSLKRKYNERFRKDEGSYREYQEVMKQLNKIENSIIGNKVKIEIMKERMNINKKINDNTMVKVRKLNMQGNGR